MIPNSINDLIESFKLLPGIGTKTAERLAFSIIDMDINNVEFFSDSLVNVKKKIKHCKICNTLTDEEECFVCNDQNRNNEILCVLDDSKNVFLFEKMGIFKGKYHVLDGLISPLDGINPEDIGINKLLERIKKENNIKSYYLEEIEKIKEEKKYTEEEIKQAIEIGLQILQN